MTRSSRRILPARLAGPRDPGAPESRRPAPRRGAAAGQAAPFRLDWGIPSVQPGTAPAPPPAEPAPGPAAPAPRPEPDDDAVPAPPGPQAPAPAAAPRPGPPAAPDPGPVPPPRRRRRKPDPPYTPGIAATAVDGNLLTASGRVSAWFVLPPEPWSFRPEGERAAAITAHAARLAQLVGRRCWIRVTTRPYPVRQWAERLDRSVRGRHPVMPGPCPRHPLRSEPGCPGCVPGHAWLDWLRDQQLRVHRWGIDEKVVYLGVELEARESTARALARLAGLAAPSRPGDTPGLAEVTAAVAGQGLRGAPATPEEMRWLLVRSCWLHMPAPRPVTERKDTVPYALPAAAPAALDEDGLAQFTDGWTRTAAPFGRTIAITRPDGFTRHVAVLTLGSGWAGEETPGDSPWLTRTDLLPFPAEWAVTVDIRDRRQVAGEMHRKIAEIRHQAAHYGEHGMPVPPAASRQLASAQRLEDEQHSSSEALAGRVLAWARVAVAGDTPEEALARAGQVAERYSPAIPVIHPPDQLALAREFIPGEGLSSRAHARRMPVTLLAAGMPAATARIGRSDGFPVGRTCGLATRAVTLHPWLDIEDRDRSGLITVTGTLGSGKTTFGGLLAYMAVRAGIPSVILDPSGLLDRLCDVPELAASARAVNLLHAPPGTLAPHSLIADPRPGDFTVRDDGGPEDPGTARRLHEEACAAAEVQRRQLAREILRMLLPAEMQGREATAALSKAAATVPATAGASLADILDAMRAIGDDYGIGHNGIWLADQLAELADHPWGRLFFPAAGDAAPAAGGDITSEGRLLTVMTLRGLVPPEPALPPERWTTEQRLSVPLIHLAAWLTRRHILDRPRHVRKLTVMDEAHQLTRGAIGQALVNETGRESRKFNHVAVLMSQSPQDLQLGDVGNLIGMALAGRTDGTAEQEATLGFLGLPPGHGYEPILAGLSRDRPGQFLASDGAGGKEIIQVDLEGCSAELRRALDSTPTGRPPAPAGPAQIPAAPPAVPGEAAS